MRKWAISGLLTIAVIGAIGVAFRTFGIPPGYDPKTSFAVAEQLSKNYGKLVPTTKAEADGKGATLYVSPLKNFGTKVTIYEVTTPSEMAEVEVAARKALATVPQAQSITIRFMQEQLFEVTDSGSKRRGAEVEVKQIKILRDA